MREIKFRAWDKRSQRMIYGPFWIGNESNEMVTFYDSTFTEALPCNDQILMQYIGLKDKSEKEIYEGDIVSVAYSTLDDSGNEVCEHIISDIFYCEEEAQFRINPPGGRIIDITDPEDVEVIGNIYENSELLK